MAYAITAQSTEPVTAAMPERVGTECHEPFRLATCRQCVTQAVMTTLVDQSHCEYRYDSLVSHGLARPSTINNVLTTSCSSCRGSGTLGAALDASKFAANLPLLGLEACVPRDCS